MINNDNFLYELQQSVAEILQADQQLSSIQFLCENSKQIDYEIKQNLAKQGVVSIVMTPKASFIGRKDDGKLVFDISELTIMTTENTSVNRTNDKSLTGQDISMRILKILGEDNYGTFCPIAYEQGEDSGLLVNKVTFSCTINQQYK